MHLLGREARDAMMHRTAPHPHPPPGKTYLVQNVNSAAVEKLCSKGL